MTSITTDEQPAGSDKEEHMKAVKAVIFASLALLFFPLLFILPIKQGASHGRKIANKRK